jgi:hypothetical protein
MIIWKYTLELEDEQEILVPTGYEFLSVQEYAGSICLWFLVDSKANKESVPIYILGTGWEDIDMPARKFLGTVQINRYVWHVFT